MLQEKGFRRQSTEAPVVWAGHHKHKRSQVGSRETSVRASVLELDFRGSQGVRNFVL